MKNYEQHLDEMVHDYKITYGKVVYHETENKEKEFNRDVDFQY